MAKLYLVLTTIVTTLIGGVVYGIIENNIGFSGIILVLCLIVSVSLGFGVGYIGAIFLYAYGELVDYLQQITKKLDLRE
jgi:hypothetical protein